MVVRKILDTFVPLAPTVYYWCRIRKKNRVDSEIKKKIYNHFEPQQISIVK